ncbi:MAG: CvpA family protein [Holosporales bacterium]|jgi:membrane protein required for colicin V production|nr:CvpA family protein [Holosporales bacterium]
MISVQAYELNFVDYSVLGFMALSGIIGFVRGFVLEFFGICSWVLAFVGAKLMFACVNQFFAEHINNEALLCATDWFVSYSCAFIILTIIKHLAAMAIKGSHVSGLDRLIGFPFGMARGFIIISVFLFVFLLFSLENTPECFFKSRCYPFFNATVRIIFRCLEISPQELREKIENVKAKITESDWSQELKETEKQVEVLSNPEPKQPETDE